MSNIIPSCIFHEPEEEYHSRSRSGEYLSSHMLSTFQRMPYKYYARISGFLQEPEKKEYIFGSAAHKMILEGEDAFNETYIVSDGPINERTGKVYGKDSKVYLDWLSMQNGDVITTEDFAEIELMLNSILKHKEIQELLRPAGIAEGVVRADLDGIPCQIRMDWFSPQVGIVDLKTCRDIEFFEHDMRSFGYAFQLAFYRSVLKAATGIEYPVHVIAVDKTQFHVAGYWHIPGAELDIAERINAAAMMRLKDCRSKNIWPTGYERKQIFTLNK